MGMPPLLVHERSTTRACKERRAANRHVDAVWTHTSKVFSALHRQNESPRSEPTLRLPQVALCAPRCAHGHPFQNLLHGKRTSFQAFLRSIALSFSLRGCGKSAFFLKSALRHARAIWLVVEQLYNVHCGDDRHRFPTCVQRSLCLLELNNFAWRSLLPLIAQVFFAEVTSAKCVLTTSPNVERTGLFNSWVRAKFGLYLFFVMMCSHR